MANDLSSNPQAWAKRISDLYQKIKANQLNHFQLLEISSTATQREMETAYKMYTEEFSAENIDRLTDPEIKKKAQFVLQRIEHAFNIITDFSKRGDYEKRGFRDEIPKEEEDENLPEQAKMYYRKAKTLYGQKEYYKVISIMEQAIKMDPERPEYYLLLGKSQSQIPTLKKKAEENINKAMEMEPWNVEPYVAMGQLFYGEKLFQRAESYLRKALQIEPDHVIARKIFNEIAAPEKKSLGESISKVFSSIFKKKE